MTPPPPYPPTVCFLRKRRSTEINARSVRTHLGRMKGGAVWRLHVPIVPPLADGDQLPPQMRHAQDHDDERLRAASV